MAPTSYQSKMKGDDPKTHSQSVDQVVAMGNATVATILEGKGSDVYAVRPQDTIAEATRVMKEKHIGAVVVKDAAGALVGILSERDIVRQLADTPGQTLSHTVEALMTKSPVTCSPDEPLLAMLQRMTEGRFRHLPVMEEDRLVGVITIGDVVSYRLRELEYEALKMKQMIVG
ncbi:CBS domain-containing protein [Pseudoruegeria sp. SHC-113]|uniref:CBS domain-containing protein n=1 Tax=Pseudoruegeria sp. SHC-113 TaxID=2855439 RepID=UPI0021BB9A2D|nr:CBS domain-containing protein [Pseudoruegeria sp. SHC-113]MCT8159143.1 CBS domain-containing protein [Pseudoruegeria sp. SHC-113]